MPELLDRLAEVVSSASGLRATADEFRALSDDELMAAQRLLAEIERRTSASSALGAAEIAWRSRPDLGYAGLAQRTGARTPESLVQQLTGSTGREAATLVRVGNVVAEAESTPPAIDVTGAEPVIEAPWDGTGTAWLAPVGRAVAAGTLPVSAADAIRSGLGVPSETVTVSQLGSAAQTLVGEAAVLNADQLFKRARALRDEIDAAGVAERERLRHEQRYLKVFKRSDGMIRVDGLLAPESGGAEVLATFEAVTSPRRGGPRFVDTDEQDRAQRLLDDPRSTEQITADSLVALLRLGVDADPGKIVGSRKPAVRVLVAAEDLNQVNGTGRLEGHPDAISTATVQRQICETGTVGIVFDDDGQVLNLGREQRLFTARQRIALATRDGGCRFPGCDRPPSWCEAHHIDQYTRDHGRTDVCDGILLCRHHHMLLHNNNWHIQRRGGHYFLIPPRERDPNQTPIPLPSKSPALADLRRRRRAG